MTRLLLMPLLAAGLAAASHSVDARAQFEAASRAVSSGDLAAAEQGFQAVLKAEPANIGALGNLGVVYSRLGRVRESIVAYQRALKLAPKDPFLNLNLGLALLKQDDYRAARPHFEAVLSTQPNHEQARQLLATTQIFTGDAAKALPVLESKRNSKDSGALYFLAIAYLREGKRDDARAAFEDLFRVLPPAQANFLEGRAYYESTLFEESLAALEKARTANPELPGIWRELGKTYVSLRRSDEARSAFREALKRTPGDEEAQYFFGALLVQEGDSAGLPYLIKSRDARPDFWGSYYYLGKAALSRGAQSEAIKNLREAARLNSQEPSVYYQLARALKAAGRQGEAQSAVQRLTKLRAKSKSTGEESIVLR